MNILWIIQAVLTFLETAGAFGCVCVLVPASRDAGWKRALHAAGCAAVTALTIYQRSFVMYSRWYLLICILCCSLVEMACAAGHRWKAIGVIMVYFETLYCLEIGVYSLLAMACMWKGVLCEVQNSLTVERAGVMCVSRLVLAAGVWIVLRNRSRVKNDLVLGRRYWMLFPVAEHICLLLCDVVVENERRGETLRHGAGILILVPFLALVLILMGLYQKYKSLYQLAESQNRIYVENWEERFQRVAEKEMIYHDMKNHMVILKRLIQEGEPGKAEGYLDKIISLPDGAEEAETGMGHPLLDYLVTVKKAEAVQKGIEVSRGEGRLRAELGEEEVADWCAILGNLWDNAVEGCMRAEKPGWIYFSVRQAGNAVSVVIRNHCRPDVDSRNPVSEKRERGRHGVGMQSIRHVVNKYHGSMECSSGNGEYEVQVTLFLKER